MGEVALRAPTAEDMRAIGEVLAAALLPGDTLVLAGDLGAGKTTLVQGIAKGLGFTGHVASPTFTLVREYPGRLRIHHADVYRLDKVQDVLETDVTDATVVTLYMLSAMNVRLRPILTRDLRKGARIVSHNFAMGDWEPDRVDTFKDAEGATRTLYLWEIR